MPNEEVKREGFKPKHFLKQLINPCFYDITRKVYTTNAQIST